MAKRPAKTINVQVIESEEHSCDNCGEQCDAAVVVVALRAAGNTGVSFDLCGECAGLLQQRLDELQQPSEDES